jgi:1,2-diacylglycerol 3-alpha-glucosyltransferase
MGVHVASVVELERPLFGQLVRQVVKLSREDLETCLELQRQMDGRLGLGQIMLQRGLITRGELARVLQFQARWVATALQGDMGSDLLPCATFLSVCLPAYNEEANIEDTLDAACAVLPEFVQRFEIVVVDDGSRDRTGEIVTRYARLDPRVRLVRHERNRGYGAAVTSGLRAARGDLVCFADSDGQFSFLDLPQLLVQLKTNDVVIGYRSQRADPWHRRLNAWGWNRLVRLLLGVRVRDVDCAFKLFRREVVDRLRLTATGAAINAEILTQCVHGGLRMCEVPVAHYPRCHGAPTGAAWRVIARAFRELPPLLKYRFGSALLPSEATASAVSSDLPSGQAQSLSLMPGNNGLPGRDLDQGVERRPAKLLPSVAMARNRLAAWPSSRPTQRGPLEAPLKVCMLAACPFPANHGTPGSIREMAEAIFDLGHEVHLVTYHFGEDIPVRGPRLHRVTPWTRESTITVGPTVRRPLYDLQMVFKTLQVIRHHAPDLIHAHGYEAALVAWLCRTVTGLPTVYSGHNTMADELPSYQFIRPRWLAKALAKGLDMVVPRLADRCLPHSTNIERFLHDMGLQERTEPIVNFGIDVDWIAQGDGTAVRQRYGLGSGPTVLYTGVLDEFQRLDLLLEAMDRVLCHEPDVKLLIVVTVPQVKHLAAIRRRAAELDIDQHVLLTDPQPLAQVRDFLAAGDIAVVPRPRAPGFPIKLLNYMAAQKPCVLFASSASTGILHRKNAMLAARDTSEALAEAILELIRNPGLRDQLGRNGYRFVRRFHDRRVIAQGVCDAYAHTLAAAGRVPSGQPHFFPGVSPSPAPSLGLTSMGAQDHSRAETVEEGHLDMVI